MDVTLAFAYTIEIIAIVKDVGSKRGSIGVLILFAAHSSALFWCSCIRLHLRSFQMPRRLHTDILKHCEAQCFKISAIVFMLEVDSLVLVAMKKGLFMAKCAHDAEFTVLVGKGADVSFIRAMLESMSPMLVGGLTLLVSFAMGFNEMVEMAADRDQHVYQKLTKSFLC